MVTETPHWQLGGHAQLEVGPAEFGIQGKWVGSRFATDTNDVKVNDYFLVDLDARVTLEPLGLEKTYFQLNVSNLLDERYFGNISTADQRRRWSQLHRGQPANLHRNPQHRLLITLVCVKSRRRPMRAAPLFLVHADWRWALSRRA